MLQESIVACILNDLEDFLKEIPPQAPRLGHSLGGQSPFPAGAVPTFQVGQSGAVAASLSVT